MFRCPDPKEFIMRPTECRLHLEKLESRVVPAGWNLKDPGEAAPAAMFAAMTPDESMTAGKFIVIVKLSPQEFTNLKPVVVQLSSNPQLRKELGAAVQMDLPANP